MYADGGNLAARKGKDAIEKFDRARSLRHCCGNLDTVNYNSRSDRIVLSHELSRVLPTTTSMSAVRVMCLLPSLGKFKFYPCKKYGFYKHTSSEYVALALNYAVTQHILVKGRNECLLSTYAMKL